MVRYLVGFICALALGLVGCSEPGTGDGGAGGTAGSGGSAGSGGTAGTGGSAGTGGTGGDPPPYGGAVLDIAMGSSNVCFVTDLEMPEGGNSFCTGSDNYGSLLIPRDKQFARLDVGGFYGCGVLEGTGELECWGAVGQSGEELIGSPPTGPFVDVVVAKRVVSICGIRADGTLNCAFADQYARRPTNRAFTQVQFGSLAAAAVLPDGTLEFFGKCNVADCPSGFTKESQRQGMVYTEAAVSQTHPAWGIDGSGSIAVFDYSANPGPTAADTNGSGQFVRSLVSMGDGACALDADEFATCATTRENPYDQLGVYKDAILDRRFRELVSNASLGICGVTSGDEVYCWGRPSVSANTVADILESQLATEN